MPFVDHFEAQTRLREKAREEALRRVPRPKPEALLTKKGRERWFAQVREVYAVVLAEALKEAERLGKAHATEVRKEWEARS